MSSSQTPASSGTSHSFWSTLWALIRLRCPRCHQGKMFRGAVAMNDPCPACGLLYQREEGYFLGAMYVSSALSMVAVTPIYFLVAHLLPNWNTVLIALIAFLAYLPLCPAVFRYSRGAWVYLDRSVCPGGVSAGSYEKIRLTHQTQPTDKVPPPV